MTEYLFGPVWYSTVPNLKVDWDIVTATYVVTTNQMMQRCQRPMFNPSAQNFHPNSFNGNQYNIGNRTGTTAKTTNVDVDVNEEAKVSVVSNKKPSLRKSLTLTVQKTSSR